MYFQKLLFVSVVLLSFVSTYAQDPKPLTNKEVVTLLFGDCQVKEMQKML